MEPESQDGWLTLACKTLSRGKVALGLGVFICKMGSYFLPLGLVRTHSTAPSILEALLLLLLLLVIIIIWLASPLDSQNSRSPAGVRALTWDRLQTPPPQLRSCHHQQNPSPRLLLCPHPSTGHRVLERDGGTPPGRTWSHTYCWVSAVVALCASSPLEEAAAG